MVLLIRSEPHAARHEAPLEEGGFSSKRISMFSVKRDTWLTFFLCELTGAFIFIATSSYPITKGQGFGTGPGFYPRFLGGCMIFLGLLYLVLELLERKSSNPAHGDRSVPDTDVTYWSITWLMLLSVASTIAIKFVGFLLSGFLLTFLSVLLIKASLKGRDVVLSFFYSICLMASIYLIFELFVGIQMPRGSFFM